MTADQQQKQNSWIAFFTTLGVHSAIFLLMFFIVAWRVPNPPFPESGVELNLGFDDAGSGDVQPQEPVGSPQVTSEKVEEIKPVEQKPVEEVQEKADTKVAEKNIETSQDDESPIIVKEKKEELKPVEKEKPKVKVEEKPVSVYKPSSSKNESQKATSDREGKPGSQGDDVNKTGDKGSPQGTVDGNAMYGKPGGGGGGTGPSLDISGWKWDERPSPEVPNNESGRIVFEIKVDDSGEIIGIKTLERSVSTEAEQLCRKAIQRLTFSKTGSNVPEISTGRITFVIRAK